MKFTYNWLKDYVDIKITPQQLAEKLTMAGLEIESLQQEDGDWIFEAEVTTNRPDWLSVIGIAREVMAVCACPGLLSRQARGERGLRKSKPPAQNPKQCKLQPDIQVLDAQACSRYTGRIISGVKVAASPGWLQNRLKSIGLRPINNIVDATNFFLFQTGQPLHTFDLDKLKGGKIIVRRAKDNEEITAIDGVKRKLNSTVLVIADQASPVAIAGIMGGKDAEVTPGTKNVLLESAYFDPVAVRRASKLLGLGSDSSYRFERGVDLNGVGIASDGAARLILDLAGGAAGRAVDVGKKAFTQTKVSVRPQRVSDMLGIEIPPKKIAEILKSLGLASSKGTKDKLTFSIPSWRRDLRKEIDLIEEIARINGYDKIPSIAPRDIDITDRSFMPLHFKFQSLVRDALISFGLNEIVAYSLTDKNLDKIFQEEAAAGIIDISNPLSPDLASLRRNLMAGILMAARRNLNRNIYDVKLFEIGPAYSSERLGKQEENFLAICITGNRVDNWQDGPKPADFYYLKGIVEGLFAKLGIRQYDIAHTQSEILDAAQSARIIINGDALGFVGRAREGILAKLKIEKPCFVCQINLEKLQKYANLERRFFSLPKFPAVYRDISTLARQDVASNRIVALINQAAAGLVKDVKLFDVYRGAQIPAGHKSLVYRLTYQSSEKTLTDAEVDGVHSQIVAALKEKLAVQTR